MDFIIIDIFINHLYNFVRRNQIDSTSILQFGLKLHKLLVNNYDALH